MSPARDLAGDNTYCGMVEEKSFLSAGICSGVDSCSLTRAIKASVELFPAFLLDAAAFGGITTVLINSSSSASTLSSFASSSAEPRSKSTGGLGGMMAAAGLDFALLAAGLLAGIGADPNGAAAGAESCIGGIGADPNGVFGGVFSAAALLSIEPPIGGMGAEPSGAAAAGGESSTSFTGADANGDGLSNTAASFVA